ncbi:helix-turn-helix domain-containing protein [Enterococcus wangshanyuanii]|uniref:Mga helix-turn-helix domain-containing protein n=1 Tax=Enterococcus wangshanyuanii TaxID=2005703 RepID=A0ABQ1PVU5_9ENTE|nr:helix-turn-helix domain-containing protein [Enterococcus wangshanyuanii]GGD04574.1 hypothetical protein GCM10011573_37620 [Enterococcus wangshanyuanii]
MIHLFEKKDTKIYKIVSEFLRRPTMKLSDLNNLVNISSVTLIKDIAETNQLFRQLQIKAHISIDNQTATIDRTASFSLPKITITLFERSFKGNLLMDLLYERDIDINSYTYLYDISEASFYRKIHELKSDLKIFNLDLNTKPIKLVGREQDIRYFYQSLLWGVYRGIIWPFNTSKHEYLKQIEAKEKEIIFNLSSIQKDQWSFWIAIIDLRREMNHFVSSMSTKYENNPMKSVSFLVFFSNSYQSSITIPEKYMPAEINYETSIAETGTFIATADSPLVHSYVVYHKFHNTELWQFAIYFLKLVLENDTFFAEAMESQLFMTRFLSLLTQTNRYSYHYQTMFNSLPGISRTYLLDTNSRAQEILSNIITNAIVLANTKIPKFHIKDKEFLIAALSESILGMFKFNFYDNSYRISLLLENIYAAELVKKQLSTLNYELTISTENEDIKKADLIICETYTESLANEVYPDTQVFVLAKSYLTQHDLNGLDNFLRTAKL